MAINAQEIQGQWNTLRGKVKEKWGQLTDDDLQITGGNVDQLVGRIQQRTGEGRESIERYLTDLTSRGASTVSAATEQLGAFAHQAADRLRENYGQVADRAREGYSVAADRAREGYSQATDLVRHNPGQSIAAAFGVGIVFGIIVGLSVRSSR